MPVDSAPTPPRSISLPLFSWLLIQFAALALAVFDIPLADDFPIPPHRLALEEMLLVQIAAPALLFPLLYSTVSSSLPLIASAWPFVLLAAMLSSVHQANLFACIAYVSTWQLSLAVLHRCIRSPQSKLIATSLLALFVAAGPLLLYARSDFKPDLPQWSDAAIASLSPLLAAFALARGVNTGLIPWLILAALLCAAASIAILFHRIRRAQVPR